MEGDQGKPASRPCMLYTTKNYITTLQLRTSTGAVKLWSRLGLKGPTEKRTYGEWQAEREKMWVGGSLDRPVLKANSAGGTDEPLWELCSQMISAEQRAACKTKEV